MNIDLPEVAASRYVLPALAELPGHLVWRARQRVVAALEDRLPDSVDIHAYAVLLALAGGATRSQQALAQTVCVSRTTMTRVAGDLSERGLVERVRNPGDRRSYALTRTPEGAVAARQWRRYAEDVEDSLTKGFSLRDREDLRSLLLSVVEPELTPETPEPLRESVGFLITRVQFRMHRDFQASLAPLGIEPPHFGVLVALAATGSVSQSELARVFAVSGAHMVSLIDELEERGLVARRKVATDRRTHVIELLAPGRATIRRATPIARRAVADRLAPLSSAQAEHLVGLVHGLVTSPG